MAEQKTEDTKPAVPRRVARPFIGPAGPTAGARPLLRPTAPVERPRPAAFGASATAPAVDESLGSAVGLPRAAPLAPVVPIAGAAVAAPAVGDVALPSHSDTSPPTEPIEPPDVLDTLEPTPTENLTGRPVTSEMVAIDAFDAFEAVWGAADAGMSSWAEVESDSSPLDDLSLGSGLDGATAWADEIAVPEPGAPAAGISSGSEPAPVAPDASPTTPALASDEHMPAWLADDYDTTQSPTVAASIPAAPAITTGPDVSSELASYAAPDLGPDLTDVAADAPIGDAESWPDPLLAEYAPYIPTPSRLSAVVALSDQVEPVADHQLAPDAASDGKPRHADALAASPFDAAHNDSHVDSNVLALVPAPDRTSDDPSALAADAVFPVAHADSAAPTAPESATVDAEPDAHDAHAELDVESAVEPVTVAVLGAPLHTASLTLESIPLDAPVSARVSATLEQLARRIRSGEIDVSSVAAEASDAAVLASVLAALLGGSSTSR